MKPEVLAAQLARAQARIEILELMVEDRSREAFLAAEETRQTHEALERLHQVMPGALVVARPDGVVLKVNQAALALLGVDERAATAEPLGTRYASFGELVAQLEATPKGKVVQHETAWRRAGGADVPVLVSAVRHEDDGVTLFILSAVDLRERKQLEVELRQAQKLEALGQLAAGMAHEINTPMQFVGDNVHFLGEGLDALLAVLGAWEGEREHLPSHAAGNVVAVEERVDLAFFKERLPAALDGTKEGVQRVSSLVAAMKSFSHKSQEQAPTDLNECLKTTLTVARNEYKYVADVRLELSELPPVVCNGGELNQVFLNLIVNAAHAIEGKVAANGERGTITLTTRAEGDDVVVEVADTGGGVPDTIAHRLFEPFFTTKPVGKGTGQGLALSRSVVVDRHGGHLTFRSTPGQGTVFTVRLPVQGQARRAA